MIDVIEEQLQKIYDGQKQFTGDPEIAAFLIQLCRAISELQYNVKVLKTKILEAAEQPDNFIDMGNFADSNSIIKDQIKQLLILQQTRSDILTPEEHCNIAMTIAALVERATAHRLK